MPLLNLSCNTPSVPHRRASRFYGRRVALTGAMVLLAARGATAESALDWLTIINSYRAQAGLAAVANNTAFTAGEQNHARYMVKNNFVGHSETPGTPFFTTQGDLAARSSNVFVNTQVTTTDADAIQSWMSGPFHSIGIIDPRLRSVAFASYREADGGFQMGADLDIIHGLVFSPLFNQYPVMWPTNGASISLTQYGGAERPDPLTSCPGFVAPAGLPIILQIGSGNHPITVTASSFEQGATALVHHVFSGSNYVNPDTSQQSVARSILGGRDAVVLMPRAPLIPGQTYTPSITANGRTYTWSFTVIGPVPTVTATSPNTAPNTGLSPLTTITGTNFAAGATVSLTKTGQTAVAGTQVVVVNSGKIACRFDVTGKAAGTWNIAVKNPDGQVATQANAFTMTAAAAQPDLLIKGAADALTAYAGQNVFQTIPSSAQIKSLSVPVLGTAAYNVQAHNSGNAPAAFVVKATESSASGWTVSYRVGGTDISGQMRGASGHTTAVLAPGAGEIITIAMVPTTAVVSGGTKSVTVQVFQNALDHTVRDAVQAVATVSDVAVLPGPGNLLRSNGAMSAVRAVAATSSVSLALAVPLDAGLAADPAHYTVLVNGHRATVEGASYNGAAHRVSLQLAEGTLRTGDQVKVSWASLADARGDVLAGQAACVAR